MADWWQALDGMARFFWIVAIGASLFQLLLFAGSLFMGHEFDHGGADAHGGSAAEGVKILSVRAITAFLVGFGWCGALLMGSGWSILLTMLLAIVVGSIFMAMIFFIMRLLVSLKADGTLDYWNAVGQSGHVYVTIPAHRSGEGQVEVLFQGRLVTASAITDADEPLAPRTPVLIHSVEGQTTLVVSPAR
ncbi:MAG: hypothetical protein QM755_20365 [Luteolibacter sp.]